MIGSERMAKIDWEAHKRRRQEEYPGFTVAAYAREMGLNVNTARKFMKGEPAPTESGKSDPKPTRKGQKTSPDPAKNDPKPRKPASDPAKNDPKTAKSDPKKKAPGRSGDSDGRQEKIIKSKRYDITPKPLARGAGRRSDPDARMYAGGEQGDPLILPVVQDHTGGFTSFMNLDDDIQAACQLLGESDGDLVLAGGRYLQMYRIKDRALRKVEEDYAEGRTWFYPGTEVPMPLEMALMQAATAPAQRLAELERFIGSRKQAVWRKQQEERERHPLTLEQRLALTAEIIQQRIDNGWTALETANRLSLQGLSMPKQLEMEVAREVGFIEPITDTDGGISDAELEEQSRAYMAAQKEIMGSWLPQRREEVAAALAAEVAHQGGGAIEEDDFDPLGEVEPLAPDTHNAGSEDDPLLPLEDIEETWP